MSREGWADAGNVDKSSRLLKRNKRHPSGTGNHARGYAARIYDVRFLAGTLRVVQEGGRGRERGGAGSRVERGNARAAVW